MPVSVLYLYWSRCSTEITQVPYSTVGPRGELLIYSPCPSKTQVCNDVGNIPLLYFGCVVLGKN